MSKRYEYINSLTGKKVAVEGNKRPALKPEWDEAKEEWVLWELVKETDITQELADRKAAKAKVTADAEIERKARAIVFDEDKVAFELRVAAKVAELKAVQ